MISAAIRCARCAFENPPEARFCAECGEPFHAPGEGPRESRVAAEPTTLREPDRSSPVELGRLDLQRELAAADAARFGGLGRLLASLARETAKSARTPAIVSLAAVRATLLGRKKRAAEAGETLDDPAAKGPVRAPLAAVLERAEAVATEAKRDGLRAGQLAREVDDRSAPAAAVVREMASALELALDMGSAGWSLERSLERLGKLSVAAEERAASSLRSHAALAAELDALMGAPEDAGPR